MIRDGLYSYLTAQSGVTDEVSTRIYFNKAKQGNNTSDFPRLVIYRTSERRFPSAAGSSGLVEATFTIESQGLTAVDARDAADAVRLELDGFSGSMGSDSIRSVYLTDVTDFYDQDRHGAEVGIHIVQQDYDITYTETKPTF